MIREIAFQPRYSKLNGLESAVATLTLDISIGPRAPRKWSRTFSQNHGKTITRVFAGKIQLPKMTKSSKQDWHFRIPFQRPFIAMKNTGPSLVLDFSTTSVVTKMNQGWDLIQAREDMGSVKIQGIGFNCHYQKRLFLAQFFTGGVYVGSKWEWGAGPLLSNQPGILAMGDAGWGSKWGGQSLPLNLKPLGAPGCTWGVRPLFFFPFVVNGLAQGKVKGLQIPNDPRLKHIKFFLQGAYAWPKANALGWLFLPSLELRIGSGEDHKGAALGWGPNNPPSKLGVGLLGDPVPWCRITYN